MFGEKGEKLLKELETKDATIDTSTTILQHHSIENMKETEKK